MAARAHSQGAGGPLPEPDSRTARTLRIALAAGDPSCRQISREKAAITPAPSHSGPISHAAAAKAAAITAAEPIALERLVRSEIARGATETIEIVFPETVAFVLSAAASSVVTHNSNNTLSCSRKSEATDTRTACRIDAGGHVTLPLWSHHSAKDRQVRMIYVQQ